MVKQFFFLLALLYSLATYGQFSKSLMLNYDVSDFTIEEYDNLLYISSSVHQYRLLEDTISPALPYFDVYVIIDSSLEYQSHTVASNDSIIRENCVVAPNSMEISTNCHNLSINQGWLNYTLLTYPSEIVRYSGTFRIGGQKVLGFIASPFCFDAENGVLHMKRDIMLNISLAPSFSDSICVPVVHLRETLRKLVRNREEIDSLYQNIAITNAFNNDSTCIAPYEYVIVTCDSLKDEFKRLADWKTLKGVRTKILTVEDIYATQPAARHQLQIKQILKDYYEATDHNLQYVLLGGDNEIVPAELCHGRVGVIENNNYVVKEHETCSDLFYACLEDVDWDKNGDGKNGSVQDKVSLCYDIIVTRLSVNSIDDARNQIDRIINYERSPSLENNILMSGQTLLDKHFDYPEGRMSDTEYKCEKHLYEKYIKNYWPSHVRYKFYDTGTSFPGGKAYNFRTENLQEQLSNGYSIVNVATHGGYDCWLMEWTGTKQYYYSSDASLYSNIGNTIIVTSACETNNFTALPTCLSEAFMRNADGGVIAYYGCSDYGFASTDSIRENSSDQFNGRVYYELLTNSHHQLGRAIYDGKLSYSNYMYNNSVYRWLTLFSNALCDPEMPVYLSAPQHFNDVNTSYTNGVLSVQTGVDSCRICILSEEDMGESYYIIENNTAYTSQEIPQGNYVVSVTKTGYIPAIMRFSTDTFFLQNEQLSTNVSFLANRVYIGSDVTSEKSVGPVSITAGKTNIQVSSWLDIKNDFEVKQGAMFEVKVVN